MADPRFQKLAEMIAGYSMDVKPGDGVLIDVGDIPDEFVVELVRACRKRKGLVVVDSRPTKVSRALIESADKKQAEFVRDLEMARMKKIDCYVAVRGSFNSMELADVSHDTLGMYQQIFRPVQNQRVNKTRWVVLRWPTPSMAQSAVMSTEGYEKFYFDVCCMDYRKMEKAAKPLVARMKRADKVKILGKGTDLTFSIKGIGATACTGHRNIPDGEVFSCPTKTSANGVITFNAPSIYNGFRFENVCLTLKNGKVVDAKANDNTRVNKILDTDAGARFIGEFAVAFNPYITQPMGDILFDEKIDGSIHFTPGQAYEHCGNGNKSAVHWDLVLIQRKDYGGGELWFDGELIRKDGLFVPKDLQPLNPKNLK